MVKEINTNSFIVIVRNGKVKKYLYSKLKNRKGENEEKRKYNSMSFAS
jgi:hypothetical protein